MLRSGSFFRMNEELDRLRQLLISADVSEDTIG